MSETAIDRLLALFDVGIGLLLVTTSLTVAYSSFQAVYAEPWYMKRRRMERIAAGTAHAIERAAEQQRSGLAGSASAPGLSSPPANPPIPPPAAEDDNSTLSAVAMDPVSKDPPRSPAPPSGASQTNSPATSGEGPNDSTGAATAGSGTGTGNQSPSSGDGGAAATGPASGEEQEVYLGKWWALLFPVMASIMLMLLFFVPAVMVAILSVTFSLTGAHGMVVSLRPVMWWLIKTVHNRGWMNIPAVANVKWLGPTPMSYLLGWPISLGIVIAYWLTRAWVGNWIFNNLIGMGVCVYLVSTLRFANVKVLTIALCGLFIYDIFWVFLSESIFEENVMLKVATTISLPIVLIFPRFYTTGIIGGYALIGLGDLALPALLLAYALKWDYFSHWDTRYGKGSYWRVLMTGYVVALLVTFVAGALMAAGQPALLYIVPLTLGPFLYMAYRSGDWDNVWKRERFAETRAQAKAQIEARAAYVASLASASSSSGSTSASQA